MPPQAVRDLLRSLSRAVQRATIYPPGHPSIGVATRPFVDALAGVLGDAPALLLTFTSEGILVGAQPADAQLQEASWLAGRLVARGVASIEFFGKVPSREAERLIDWLARADALGDGEEPPAFEGCQISPVDYSRTSFRDTPMAEDRNPTVALAWHMVCRSLAGEWGVPSEGVVGSPAELARFVTQMLERQEGAGSAELVERFAGVDTHLSRLSDGTIAIVKQRLAEFLEALSPEFRDRLLSATPKDRGEKLLLLARLVDRLPRPLVVDLVGRLKFERGGSSHQFIALMTKLAAVAAGDETVAEALSGRCRPEGLPSDPASLAAPATQELLGQLLRPREGDLTGINPDSYQQQLEALSTDRPARHHQDLASPCHGDPRGARAVAHQVARIALHLLRMRGRDDPSDAACVDRIRLDLPAALADGHLDLLAQAAASLQEAAGDTGGTLTARQAVTALEFFESPEFAREIGALLETTGEINGDLAVLARTGGVGVAKAAITRLVAQPEPAVRRRLVAAIGALDIRLVRSALADLCASTPSFSRAAVSALAASGAPVASQLAEVLVRDADPVVRATAFRLLFSGRHAPPGDAVLARVLGDLDPRVVEVGIDEVERHQELADPKILTAFLDARRPAPVAPLQHRLVRLLARRRDAAARAVLIEVLGRRGRRFDQAGRRLSRTISVSLERSGGADAAAAVAAWRGSAAGLLSWLLRDVSGGTP